jgi:hypothetical protein
MRFTDRVPGFLASGDIGYMSTTNTYIPKILTNAQRDAYLDQLRELVNSLPEKHDFERLVFIKSAVNLIASLELTPGLTNSQIFTSHNVARWSAITSTRGSHYEVWRRYLLKLVAVVQQTPVFHQTKPYDVPPIEDLEIVLECCRNDPQALGAVVATAFFGIRSTEHFLVRFDDKGNCRKSNVLQTPLGDVGDLVLELAGVQLEQRAIRRAIALCADKGIVVSALGLFKRYLLVISKEPIGVRGCLEQCGTLFEFSGEVMAQSVAMVTPQDLEVLRG